MPPRGAGALLVVAAGHLYLQGAQASSLQTHWRTLPDGRGLQVGFPAQASQFEHIRGILLGVAQTKGSNTAAICRNAGQASHTVQHSKLRNLPRKLWQRNAHNLIVCEQLSAVSVQASIYVPRPSSGTCHCITALHEGHRQQQGLSTTDVDPATHWQLRYFRLCVHRWPACRLCQPGSCSQTCGWTSRSRCPALMARCCPISPRPLSMDPCMHQWTVMEYTG